MATFTRDEFAIQAEANAELFVRLGFEEDPDSFRLLPRPRLADIAAVNRIYDADIEFLVEQSTGNVLLPPDWEAECAPPPETYYIHKKVWPKLQPDALEVDEYRGTVLILADFVPPAVDSKALATWISAGLEDDNPDVVATRVGLEDARKELEEVEHLIEDLPAMVVKASNVDEEREIKKQRAQALIARKADAEQRIGLLERKLAVVSKTKEDSMFSHFRLFHLDSRKPIDSNIWRIDFNPTPEGKSMAYMATHKFNWSDFRLAVHKKGLKQPITTKQFWTPALPDDYQEINMRQVRIQRVRHGRGAFQFPDDRGFFSGQWRRGLRHGLGVELNLMGKFAGQFDQEWRRGRGTQVYANGDTLRASYACQPRRERQSLLFGDEYMDGLPEGEVHIKFVDGSVYEGEMRYGRVQGKGKYTSAVGEVVEGDFNEWAMLHGMGTMSVADQTLIGQFQRGRLQGSGVVVDLTCGRVDGTYENGLLHGFAQGQVNLCHGEFRGFFRHGFRHGRGEINFGNLTLDREVREERRKRLIEQRRSYRQDTLQAVLSRAIALGEIQPAGGVSDIANQAAMQTAQSEARQLMETLLHGDDPDYRKVEELQGPQQPSAPPEKPLVNRFVKQDSMLDGQTGAQTGGQDGSCSDWTASSEDEPDTTWGAKPQNSHHENKYEKYNDFHLDYPGDYGYEGTFKAGSVASGGQLVIRNLRRPHHAHKRFYAHDMMAESMPQLYALPDREHRVNMGRMLLYRKKTAELVKSRIEQEYENMQSYKYWRKVARRNMVVFRARNRAMVSNLSRMRDQLVGAGAAAAWEATASRLGFKQEHELQSIDVKNVNADWEALYQYDDDEDDVKPVTTKPVDDSAGFSIADARM